MRERTGMVLLEVIVSLTIFVIAALSATVWLRQVVLSVEHVDAVVDEVGRASNYLDIIALWPREDLDRHLGVRREGPWMVRVDRKTQSLYGVTVWDSTGTRTLLQTYLYRSEPVHAEQ
jgi:hypothetical protein